MLGAPFVLQEATAARTNGPTIITPHLGGATADQPRLRIATTADTSFVLALQKRFSNQLGFLPRAAIEWYVTNGRVQICQDNGQHAGYLLGRPTLRCLPNVQPLTQTAVDMTAQRRGLGLLLIEHAAAEAHAAGRSLLQAWCRVDLEANEFWRAAGFTAVGIRRPTNARAQPLILWRRPVSVDGQQRLLHLPTSAGWRATANEPRRLLSTADRRRHALLHVTADLAQDGHSRAAA